MKDHETIDTNDPLFLVSRNLDGDLGQAERIRLETALAESPSLRVQAEQLAAVARWVVLRRRDQVDVDWEHHGKLVMAALSEPDADGSAVDRALAHWGRRQPVYDERALADGIMARIAPARQRKAAAWQVIARIGAPLAAAAVVMFAVTAVWMNPAAGPVRIADVSIGPPRMALAGGASATVSFVRPPDDSDRAAQGSSPIGYMTLGSAPLAPSWDESPL